MPERQREVVLPELEDRGMKYGEQRHPTSMRITAPGHVRKDLIPEEDVVVTITHGRYAGRTR